MIDRLTQFIQTPEGASIVSLVLALIAAIAHALGYNIPLLSAVLHKAAGGSPATMPMPSTPNFIGGVGGPGVNPASLHAAVGRAHPLFDALRGALAAQHGLPAEHPLIHELAALSLAAAPTLLTLFPATAPFAPLVSGVAALLERAARKP